MCVCVYILAHALASICMQAKGEVQGLFLFCQEGPPDEIQVIRLSSKCLYLLVRLTSSLLLH